MNNKIFKDHLIELIQEETEKYIPHEISFEYNPQEFGKAYYDEINNLKIWDKELTAEEWLSKRLMKAIIELIKRDNLIKIGPLKVSKKTVDEFLSLQGITIKGFYKKID